MVKKQKINRAASVLAKIGGEAYAQTELANIATSFKTKYKQLGRKAILEPDIKPILLIGVVIAVFQQWCGINIIFNYAEEIFTEAGYSLSDMLFNIVITGSVNVVFTLVAMRTVDSWGRKKLMLFGSAGLAFIYLLLGLSYYMQWTGGAVMILVVMAIAVYAMSLAPITWVVISEIFPNRVRGIAMSIATLSLWVACFLLTFTFPILNRLLDAHGTFWLYSLISMLGYLFIRAKLPETKGKTLEEIEQKLGVGTSEF